jgi:hypothetical protein
MNNIKYHPKTSKNKYILERIELRCISVTCKASTNNCNNCFLKNVSFTVRPKLTQDLCKMPLNLKSSTLSSFHIKQEEADADPFWYEHKYFVGMGDHYFN